MFSQRLAIGVSFLLVVVAYALHSIYKPSELGSRGLDHRLYRIREFRVEKRWGCRYCGFVKNIASKAECMQCGTNQIGEQEILPTSTVRGVPTEAWTCHSLLLGDQRQQQKQSHEPCPQYGVSTLKKGREVGANVLPPPVTSKAKSHWQVVRNLTKAVNEGGLVGRSAGYGEIRREDTERRLVVWGRDAWPFAYASGPWTTLVGSHPATHHKSKTAGAQQQDRRNPIEAGTGTSVSGMKAIDGDTTAGGSSAFRQRGGGGGPARSFAEDEAEAHKTRLSLSAASAAAAGGRGNSSEVPTALALAELGFVVAGKGRSGAELGCALSPPSQHGFPADWGARLGDFGTAREAMSHPSKNELAGLHLEWVCAQGGVCCSHTLPPGLLGEIERARKCFFPEKVAWFYEKIKGLQKAVESEVTPTEFAIAYPNSVLRDSVGFLNKVTPLQCLRGKYRVQFVSARSHTRGTAVEGELEERWLAALFRQFCDPATSTTLSPADDGRLELATLAGPGIWGGSSKGGKADSQRLQSFTALGRSLAMALVSRSFVTAPLSPVLCKLLVGRPLHFLDLLHSNQALFQDLLRLMLLSPSGVAELGLRMPPTSTSGGEHGPRNSSRDGVKWAGRGSRRGCRVDVSNRLEYVHRKMEEQMFGRMRPELAAVRRALYDVVPHELLSVFDHREFIILLNGHHKSDDTLGGSSATI